MYKFTVDTRRRVATGRCALLAAVLAAGLAPQPVPAQATGTAPAAPTLLITKRIGDTATVYWSAPSGYTDGSPLGAAVLTYTVYSAAPGATWKATPTGSALTYTSAALVKGSVCFAITATVSGLESAATPAACIGVAPAANPPGAVGIR